MRPGGVVSRFIKKNVYGETPILDYLASNPLKRPWDNQTAECDYKTMTNKEFYQKYVKTS